MALSGEGGTDSNLFPEPTRLTAVSRPGIDKNQQTKRETDSETDSETDFDSYIIRFRRLLLTPRGLFRLMITEGAGISFREREREVKAVSFHY